MSSQSWRKNTPVTARLESSAFEYSLLQAVRLLERAAVMANADRQDKIPINPVAGFAPPATESVRFLGRQSLEFAASEVSKISRIDNAGQSQWQLLVNLIGLTGAIGVMPYHYSELVLQRQKVKDDTLEHFLNLFNHRITSLFYQASIKYRLPLQYERRHLFDSTHNRPAPHTQALLALLGLGSDGLRGRLHTRDESLIYYGGFFNQQIRTTSNLRQMLGAHFGIPVDITQFVGQWQDLIDDVRSKLPDLENPQGRNAVLGGSAMLGSKGWFAQSKIYILLGPLNKTQLKKFAPGTTALKALNELVRLYLGLEIDYELIIQIYKKDIPDKTRLHGKDPPIMGWNTWLRSKPQTRPQADETLDLQVAASQMR